LWRRVLKGTLADIDDLSLLRANELTAISMRDAVPSAAAAMVVTIAVPPVMTTACAPALACDKCTGTCSNQSADGSATAAAGYSTNESTAERTTTYLRRGRLHQYRANNHERREAHSYPMQHLFNSQRLSEFRRIDQILVRHAQRKTGNS
jgi:hypothetical protein